MDEIITYISGHWVDWLFSAGYALLVFICGYLLKRMKKESRLNQAMREGIQALLRQQIIDFCLRYEEAGEVPVWAKQAEEKAYKAYEALGGNDVAHAMHNRFMELPPKSGNE